MPSSRASTALDRPFVQPRCPIRSSETGTPCWDEDIAHPKYIQIAGIESQFLISSIKEKVKKNTSTAAGDFLTFQPMYMSKDGSDLPPHGLGSLHSRVRLFGFSLPAVFIVWLRRSQSVLKPTSKTVVRCQPWFYLRLVAYSFFGLSERA